jgi:hypothetical protein
VAGVYVANLEMLRDYALLTAARPIHRSVRFCV